MAWMQVEFTLGSHHARMEANDESALLRAVKEEAAKRAPLLMRAGVRLMSDLQFAAQVVSRANAQNGRNDPAPRSAREFLDWAVAHGYAAILSD